MLVVIRDEVVDDLRLELVEVVGRDKVDVLETVVELVKVFAAEDVMVLTLEELDSVEDDFIDEVDAEVDLDVVKLVVIGFIVDELGAIGIDDVFVEVLIVLDTTEVFTVEEERVLEDVGADCTLAAATAAPATGEAVVLELIELATLMAAVVADKTSGVIDDVDVLDAVVLEIRIATDEDDAVAGFAEVSTADDEDEDDAVAAVVELYTCRR